MRVSIQHNITILVLTLKHCDFEWKLINIFQLISCMLLHEPPVSHTSEPFEIETVESHAF
jgi:hypothetical protein